MSNSLIEKEQRLPDEVETQIIRYFDQDSPASFFLFAGAGSGKTGTLVEILKALRIRQGDQWRRYGKQIGVITYTNAACDEIKHRLDSDPLFAISTIHSFVWSLIQDFHHDIKAWLDNNLAEKFLTLEEAQRKGRSGSASNKRSKQIESIRNRRNELKEINRFTYSATGDNKDRGALNHSEVIELGAFFIKEKPSMQEILVNRFPVLFIDESQDTNKTLMESLLAVQSKQEKRFCLGLLGDMMQRIYMDGKFNLDQSVPQNWHQPKKKINYRSPPRIVKLINKIRMNVDRLEQTANGGWREDGCIRLFILPSNVPDKSEKERQIAQKMAQISGDSLWSEAAQVKKLVLEHHMAANRMGFSEMFMALYQVDSLKTGLLDGEHGLPGLALFSKMAWPLIQAKRAGNEFLAMAILRKYSPLLSSSTFQQAGTDQLAYLNKVSEAVDRLVSLYKTANNLCFLDVLRCVSRTGLFEIPEQLRPMSDATLEEQQQTVPPPIDPEPETLPAADDEIDAWNQFLSTPFKQIEPYLAYVSRKAEFDTHQGVKGRQFPRVMAIIDDSEARGFLFPYEKLFGAKPKSPTDIKHEQQGEETSIDRTRRLFYVICSRAQSSLAIVIYTDDSKAVRKDAIDEKKWFSEEEVV